MEKVARRKGEMLHMEHSGTGITRLEYKIPTRGLIGYRNEFLTDTRGLGIMSSRFVGYGPWAGEIVPRTRGSLVSTDTGEATGYAMENLQARATLFVSPMDKIYAGMIVGENSRADDMPCNPSKKKHLTNHRQATKEMLVGMKVPRKPTLESGLEWIAEDELVEITPESIRLRKIILSADDRKKADRRGQAVSAAGYASAAATLSSFHTSDGAVPRLRCSQACRVGWCQVFGVPA